MGKRNPAYPVDLTGMRFGRLLVIEKDRNYQGNPRRRSYFWRCQCDCGVIKSLSKYELLKGKVNSCGCLRRELVTEGNYTHHLSQHPLHARWCDIKKRCYNPNCIGYENYGGRGITMCQEWRDSFDSFYNWAIHNGYEPHLSIDRIEVDGPYSPTNCRWTDRHTQNNNKRCCYYLLYHGEKITLSEAARRSPVSRETIRKRLEQYHWSPEKAIETPLCK